MIFHAKYRAKLTQCIYRSIKVLTQIRINTEQAKRNMLNELLNANIESRLDKSPIANPDANYDKLHTCLIDLKKNTSHIEA